MDNKVALTEMFELANKQRRIKLKRIWKTKIYADLIIAGRKTFDEVPAQIKEDVKLVLQGYVAEGELTPQQ